MKYLEIKEFAKRLTNNPKAEEKILWQILRKRLFHGYRFIRKHPIIYESQGGEYFFYIPDFYCTAKNVVIEIDGKIHDFQKTEIDIGKRY